MNKLVEILGDDAEEIWENVGEWKIYLLDEEVLLVVRKLLTGHNAGKFMASGSHRIIADGLGGPYTSVQLENSIEASLQDWALGMKAYVKRPGAKMVRSED
jgi:hypothetical protein